MVRMPKRVLKRWAKIIGDPDRGDDSIIEVLFSSRLEPSAAAAALAAAVARVAARFHETHTEPLSSYGELPFVGEWDVMPVPEGALLVWGRKSNDTEGELLTGLGEDLTRQGITGKLDLYMLPEIPTAPERLQAIQATLQACGTRVPARARTRWKPDQTAFERLIDAACNWCLNTRPDRAVTVSADAMPAMIVRRAESPSRRVHELIPGHFATRLQSIGEDRYRKLEVHPSSGRIDVLEGGPCLYREGWETTLASLIEFIRLVHADTIYANVRRRDIRFDREPSHARLRGADSYAIPYADHLAPDAYTVQLLGPAYPAKLPIGANWRATALGHGRRLLEHTDPGAWVGELPLDKAIAGALLPSDELVASAREELAPMLFPAVRYTDLKVAEDLADPPIVLSQHVAARARAISDRDENDHIHAALVLRDGRVIEHVELSPFGAILLRIHEPLPPNIDPHDVADVRRLSSHAAP